MSKSVQLSLIYSFILAIALAVGNGTLAHFGRNNLSTAEIVARSIFSFPVYLTFLYIGDKLAEARKQRIKQHHN